MIRTTFIIFIFLIIGCTNHVKKLPILGNYDINTSYENGVEKTDTVFHYIKEFAFVNQDSLVVTNQTFDDKIYITDFFFTSCPSICPIMKGQMLRVYETFQEEGSVVFLSHTIDPEYDTVALLKDYSERLGVESNKWHFVTGDKQAIYKIAQLSYMSVVADEPSAPGGYIHSGRFILVDKKRHIRGVYNGTDQEDVNILIADIKILLEEYAIK